MPTYLCKITNNNHICSILGRRKMTQKYKKETQKTQNETKIPHGTHAMRYLLLLKVRLLLISPNAATWIAIFINRPFVIILFCGFLDIRACKDGLCLHLENIQFWLYIFFLFHSVQSVYLMITFIVLPPRFTMLIPF